MHSRDMNGQKLTVITTSPTHFRVWSARNHPYNLCEIPSAHSISVPTRSLVTCKACLEKLR